MATAQTISEYISSLESCSNDFEFPAGGVVSIPLDTERALADILRTEPPLTHDTLSVVRQGLSPNQCYGCVIFAVRMAILAARNNDIELFRLGLHGLLFDTGQVDYRDVLGVLSITEYCAVQLGLDFRSEVVSLSNLCDDRVRANIAGYLERPPEMRTVEVHGFVVEERTEGLCISSRS